jgi:branched-subunit amino acid aminotransferase/4-amino-4-deoxychorismate lyase
VTHALSLAKPPGGGYRAGRVGWHTMVQAAGLTLEINGQAAAADQLRALALSGYGHFTAMQVREGRTRGLRLHLDRLDSANREMFGAALDGGQVRDFIRHALGGRVGDASVRVIVQQPVEEEPPWVTVTVRPPADPLPDSRLQSVAYQRSVAHLKHSGDFGQHYYGLLAERNGFDEALLTGPDGLISEGSTTNIGFFDGTAVVWPAAAMLAGVTMQLVAARLTLPQRHGPVRVADLGSFGAVFITNSHGVAAATEVDARRLPVDTAFMGMLRDAYESVPWDEI